jgi:diguanylate cyclase (GGDEF)-like protein
MRGPLIAGVVIVGASAALLPVARHTLAPTTSFVPAILAVVACFDLMCTYLLISDYLDTGDARMLCMAAAYIWSLVLMAGYALAFPGVFSNTPPFAAVPSTTAWLYVGWHVGFPVLLGVAWAPWPARRDLSGIHVSRRVVCCMVVVAIAGVAASVVALCVHFADDLPTLIVGSDTSLLTRVTAPFALPIVAAALIVVWRGLRHGYGPERWATVAVLICFCDLLLTYSSGHRYSVGWYSARTLTMAGAGVVLFAMFRSFRHLKATAVANAATDSLTGLPNRRTLDAKLARELSRSRRVHSPLTVLILDLDRLKELNDAHGHAAGDLALQSAASAWTSQLRPNDLLCRTGGDEFTVVLPDTSYQWAATLALRLKGITPSSTGVSIGIATWNGEDDSAALLASADRDMYRTKPQRLIA